MTDHGQSMQTVTVGMSCNAAPCLEELAAAAQELLVVRAEADSIGNAFALKYPHVDRPQPQHCQDDQQRLVVDVEQLQMILAGCAQAGHDCVRCQRRPS